MASSQKLGRGWLACFQDSSTLPTQDAPPGGTQKGAVSLPPAQMGRGRGRLAVGKSTEQGVQGWRASAALRRVTWRHLRPLPRPHFPHLDDGESGGKGVLWPFSREDMSATNWGGVQGHNSAWGLGQGGHGMDSVTHGLRHWAGAGPGSVRGALEGRRVWGSWPGFPAGTGGSLLSPWPGPPRPLSCFPSSVQPERGFLKHSLETQRKETKAWVVGPEQSPPTQDGTLPALHPTPTQPSLTWKKAALARCTGMLWELPVGMGARAEGRICGQS